MLNCLQAQAMISQRLDGELPEYLGQDLQAHLQNCPACKKIAAVDETISRRFRKALAIQPASLLLLQEKVLSELAEAEAGAPPPSGHLRPWRGYLLTAAAAILVGMFLGTVYYWPRWNPAQTGGGEGLVKAGPGAASSREKSSLQTEPLPTLVIERRSQDLTPIYSELEPPMVMRTQHAKKIFIDSLENLEKAPLSPGQPAGRASPATAPELRLEIEKVNQKMYQLVNQPWK